MKVTFVVPTLNEEQGIGPTLEAVDRAAFAARGWEVDFLVVDGESTDRTRDEAEQRGAHVVVEPRRGYGRAYKTGFAAATGDVLVTGDADGSYRFDLVHEYLDRFLADDKDFVTCNRYADLQDGSMSPLHRLGNWALSTTTRVLFRVRLRDSQSGLWLIRRDALPRLPIADLPDGMAFSQALKVEALRAPDIRSAEYPSGLRPRLGEKVLSSWRDGFGNLKALWVRRLTGHWPA